MTLPTTDTRVSYPAGSSEQAAIVVHIEELENGRAAVLLDATCAHPVDAGWPDQGADRGMLRTAAGDDIRIDDCVVAATDGETLSVDADIPVLKGEQGWAFVVAHIVASDAALAEGDTVQVIVDADYRNALSIGHTACHVASLALNKALAGRWTKDARADGLGSSDFDGLAIESSTIHENGSTDRFRLNKSLRRKGFTTDGLSETLPQVQSAINATLATWIDAGSAVHIACDGELLTDRRYWACELEGTAVRIPCGGTHASSLAALGALRVELAIADVDGTPVLTMETTVTPR